MTGDLASLLINDLKLPVDQLADHASLSHAGFDSLAVVELSLLLADRYQIDISESDITSAATLGDLDRLITTKRSER
ncbi:acyl carrier protein [Streptomyces buecherae]|uniref:acyl carrier protein n=1 Tax=Streptomyces buecherae TaxID=2763006 RepID=UPI001C275105|nr:acyl carrier protein [Streptomyces buecherae]